MNPAPKSVQAITDELTQRLAAIESVAFPTAVDPFGLYSDRLEQLIRHLMWEYTLVIADESFVWAAHRNDPRFYFTVVENFFSPEPEAESLRVSRRFAFYPHRELAAEVARLQGVFKRHREQLDAMRRAFGAEPLRARRAR